ncbi:MAG: MFS transporter [Desulfuromonadales bacterium]|nr:MFS transporter [Desulfuromonadales bacterium]
MPKDLGNLLRALRSRNYRLFATGQGISLLGTWMQQVAMSWLVYRLTGSPLWLGVTGFASQIPTFLFASFAGVFADRWNRRRAIVITQSFAMLQAAILAVIYFLGIIHVWHIIILSLMTGFINAFDNPLRQSFVIEMVEHREDLGNAIAINSSLVQAGRLIGPAIAGILIASVGEGVCFVINSMSYLGVIIALLAMHIKPKEKIRSESKLFEELAEGISYAFSFKPIKYILFIVAVQSLMGMPYVTLIPAFAKTVLHGNAHTYGTLMASAGFGSLLGTLFLASRKNVIGLGKGIMKGVAVFGLSIALFAVSKNYYLSLGALAFAGFGAMTTVASSNTLIQTIVEEDKRGRVMSLFAMSFMGMTPFGNLAAGFLAKMLGIQYTVLLGAAACLVVAVFFARQLPYLRESVKPIYIKLGLITETPSGIETSKSDSD